MDNKIRTTYEIGANLTGSIEHQADEGKVYIEEGLLCWILLEDRKAFIDELNAVIDKYKI